MATNERSSKNWAKKIWNNSVNWIFKNRVKSLVIGLLISLLILLVVNISGQYCSPESLGKTNGNCEIGTFIDRLGYAIGGVIGLLAVVIASERSRALDKTAEAQIETVKAQEKRNIQERFKNASKQLVEENPNVRLEGAYELYYLAIDSEYRLKYICDRLCRHIRDLTTSEVAVGKNSDGKEIKYSEKYATKPSNEIQSILDILTNKDNEKDFPFKSHWINLANAYLNGVSLDRAQLQGASLYEAHLQGANLGYARLQGANLTDAQLQEANLGSAHLQEANLTDAQLQRANLREAQLQGAKLGSAHLQEADLSSAHLQDANLIQAQFQGANLVQTQLQGANLREAQPQGANLTDAQLQRAYLTGAQLQGANLREAQLQEANLSYAQLQGTNLERAELQGANLSSARLQGANLERAELQGANLSKVEFQGAILSQAQLQGANLEAAQLQGANLSSAELEMTNLSSAQFQGADLIKTDFRGAFTEQKDNTDFNIDAAIKKLKDKRNQKDDIQNAIFSGGVRKDQLEYLKKRTIEMLEELADIKDYDQDRINDFNETMNKVEKILENNINKPIDTSIPSEAITGVYPEAEADKIINMLEELNKQLIEIRQYYWGNN